MNALKNLIIIALAFCGLLGCERFRPNPPTEYFETFSLNTPAELKYGQCLRDYSNKVNICFHGVISDSRCPENTECDEVGEAVVQLSFYTDKNENFTFTLKSGESYTTSNGYIIKFTNLLPHPNPYYETTSRDYKAKVVISKE